MLLNASIASKAFVPAFIGTCHMPVMCYSRYWGSVMNKAKEDPYFPGADKGWRCKYM